MNNLTYFLLIILILITVSISGCINQEKAPPPESIPGPSIIDLEDIASSSSGVVIADTSGREVTVPKNISHVLCSGPGCMRYLTYLQSSDKAVAADEIERDTKKLFPLTYLVAKPNIRTLPSSGYQNGRIDTDQVLNLSPRPDLIIIMTDEPISGEEIQKKTEIPVIILHEGDLGSGRGRMNYALRVMGVVLGKSSRAEEVIRFFDKVTDNLQSRTYTLSDFQQKSAYFGGYSAPNPQGIYSTTTRYLPLTLIKVRNSADDYIDRNNISGPYSISKEALSRLTPDAIFVDMMTWFLADNGISELEKTDILQEIPAVRQGEVYGLLPNSLYGEEHESDIINAFLIGKVLYPTKFMDVEPKVIADYIHSFLYGEPLFESVNRQYGGMILSRIPLFSKKIN